MIRLAIILVLAMLASLASWSILNATYSYTAFASKEARQSLEVTEEQYAELQASRVQSDIIAFGLFSCLLGAVCGAGCDAKVGRNRLIAAVVGLFVGFLGGAMGAWLGNWHDAYVQFGSDATTYWFVRSALILTPIGIASGLASQLGARSTAADGIVGGALGAGIAAVIYTLLPGSFTPLEGHENIFPSHSGNRLLLFSLAAVCISGLLAGQAGRKSRSTRADNKTSEVAR